MPRIEYGIYTTCAVVVTASTVEGKMVFLNPDACLIVIESLRERAASRSLAAVRADRANTPTRAQYLREQSHQARKLCNELMQHHNAYLLERSAHRRVNFASDADREDFDRRR